MSVALGLVVDATVLVTTPIRNVACAVLREFAAEHVYCPVSYGVSRTMFRILVVTSPATFCVIVWW